MNLWLKRQLIQLPPKNRQLHLTVVNLENGDAWHEIEGTRRSEELIKFVNLFLKSCAELYHKVWKLKSLSKSLFKCLNIEQTAKKVLKWRRANLFASDKILGAKNNPALGCQVFGISRWEKTRRCCLYLLQLQEPHGRGNHGERWWKEPALMHLATTAYS